MLVQLAKRFARAAAVYDQYAALQWQVASECAAMVDPQCARVLDVGIGTGFVARQLLNPEVIGLDIAAAMLQQAREQAHCSVVQADMQQLPLANQCVDGLVSSLAIQWAADTAQCLTEWRRVVRAGGQLVFATLVDGSLQQLHQCRQAMGLASNRFLTDSELRTALQRSGWQNVVLRQQRYTYYYADVWQLASSLKLIGAQTRTEASSSLATRRHWRTLAEHYAPFRQSQGLPLTYEVMYVLAQH